MDSADDKEITSVRLVLGELVKSKLAVHECVRGLEQIINFTRCPTRVRAISVNAAV